MNRLILIISLLLSVLLGTAQEVYDHQYSSIPDTSRFEIVQSQQGVRYTFKIDKYLGIVYQLVETKEQSLAWQQIGNEPMIMLSDYLSAGRKVNFQLFISGLGIRYIFLLHIHTGTTWQLAEVSETKELFWLPLD